MNYCPLKSVSVGYWLGGNQIAGVLAQVGAVTPNGLVGQRELVGLALKLAPAH